MALGFQDEVDTYLTRVWEQDPAVSALAQGTMKLGELEIKQAVYLLIRLAQAERDMLIRAAQEIDKLHAAADGG